MEETFLEKTIHALVFFAICAGIVFLGWREPLRYRFLSTQQIAEIENQDAPSVQGPAGKGASSIQGSTGSAGSEWVPKANRLSERPRYKSGEGTGQIYSLPYRPSDGLKPPPDRKTYGH